MAGIILPHARIACAESGSGQPVVLVHGSASSAAQWRDLTRDLENRFRVLAPDLHGHGKSDPWPGPKPLRLSDDAAILAAITERVGEPIHLVGHSYGGAVALCFAHIYPERLRSLALVEPVAFHLLRQARRDHATLLGEVEELADTVARAADKDGVGMNRFVDFWNWEGAWSRLSTETQGVIMKRAGAVAGHFAATLGETTPDTEYRTITVSTLIVCGTESPAVVHHIADELNNLLPRSKRLYVRGAGHMLPFTHADTVNMGVIAHFDCTNNNM